MSKEPANERDRPMDWGTHSYVAEFNEGNSRFVVDDGCYLLINRGSDGTWGKSSWVFPEAVKVLKGLPDQAKEAERIGGTE